MATLKRFEDIEAWQHAREPTQQIYRTSRNGAFAKDFSLRDQIRRAAVSIGSNIAEGFERGNKKEFCYFLSVEKGSAGEVRGQLYVALDEGYIDQACFDSLYRLCTQTMRLIGGLRSYLKNSPSQPRTRNS